MIDDKEVKVVCERARSAQPPVADVPGAAERTSLRGCDAEAAYYGIGRPVDYELARRCAFAHTELGPHGSDNCRNCSALIDGPGILMMIYANGRGVPVNFDLALRFACDYGGSPGELSLRTGRLSKARDRGTLDAPVDACDAAVSGYMAGVCAAHQERVAGAARSLRWDVVSKTLPHRELAALKRAASQFFDAREQLEVDLTGTARAELQIEERSKLEDDFVSALEQIRNPQFPPEAGDRRKLETELAQCVDACKPNPDMEQHGFPTCAGLRKTERAWLTYRAAFVALAIDARPDSHEERWFAWLTQQRLTQVGCEPND
jgi:hypothetical protein